ncbi:MAG: HDIG domain-containing protein [Chloroflexi bacterium CFX4]|nr:HDIG domain-containing protein [Chloroflexi bacterium CFX4]MDL1922577.1 HDIG domain-containing protein [Chloroflexi bacterium CFX3]
MSLKHFRLAITWRQVQWAVLGAAFLSAASAIVAFTTLTPAEPVTLGVGQVAPYDILAPISLTYESDVLTRLARQAAADAVRDVYDPPNPSVLRQQVQHARDVLTYMENVRNDPYGTLAQRVADLRAIEGFTLSDDLPTTLLRLGEREWRDVDAQVITLLERTMRDQIREDTLPDVLARLPNLVSFTVSETQAAVIVGVVRNLIKPNAFLNEERTRAARRAAFEAVQPVTRNFLQGQIVVRGGTIVSEADLEALTKLKLIQPPDQRLRILGGALMAVLLITMLGVIYARRYHPALVENVPLLIFLSSLFLIFLAGARLYNLSDFFLSRVYPVAAFALIMVALTEARAAFAASSALALLIGLTLNASLEITVLAGASSVAAILSLRRAERLESYFMAGVVIGGVNIVVGLLFGLLENTADPTRLLLIIPASLLNGMLAAGLGLVGLYLGSSLLNMPSSIKLLALSQPSQPLLQRLLREAPGTYQHSLQVANLAELAAERIGADAQLVRVGALYHDIGKLHAPLFFVENQAEGVNPHETLSPRDSARIIIAHVVEGEKLGRRERLPTVFIDFIREHHGTTRTLYFYNKAVEAANGDESAVNPTYFTYPGPRPRSRESAILMLADTSESVIRSKRTRDKQEIADVVQEIIRTRLTDGQLDESGLTVNDLKIIQEVFVSSLQGVFHPRIAYPTLPPRDTQELKVLPAGTLPPTEEGATS